MKNKVTPNMDVLKRVRTVLVDGKEQQIVDFLNKLDSQDKLPDGLQEALDKLGNNPVKEPELYKTIQDLEGNMYMLEIAEAVIGDGVDDYSATEIGKFIYEVKQHITSTRDKDDAFKVTDATANCNLPRMRATQKIAKLGEEIRALQSTLTKDNTEEFQKEAKEIGDKIEAIVWEESGLKKEDLSDWEQVLVMEMVSANTQDALLTSMGKPPLN